MTVQLTIRNVSSSTRDELAARAARRGQSMQEYLRQELERLASLPDRAAVTERIQRRKAIAGTTLSDDEILNARDAGRR